MVFGLQVDIVAQKTDTINQISLESFRLHTVEEVWSQVFILFVVFEQMIHRAVYDWVGYTRLEWETTFAAFGETTVPNPIVNRSNHQDTVAHSQKRSLLATTGRQTTILTRQTEAASSPAFGERFVEAQNCLVAIRTEADGLTIRHR